MQSFKITIDVNPKYVPALVCRDYSDVDNNDSGYQIAAAVADALGIKEYLSQPERIYELRRWVWERGNVGW